MCKLAGTLTPSRSRLRRYTARRRMASARTRRTWRTSRRDGGRRRRLSFNSFPSLFSSCVVARVGMAGDEVDRFRVASTSGRSLRNGLGGGGWLTVYGRMAAMERSHFFGTQTPTRTRQTVITRSQLGCNIRTNILRRDRTSHGSREKARTEGNCHRST